MTTKSALNRLLATTLIVLAMWLQPLPRGAEAAEHPVPVAAQPPV